MDIHSLYTNSQRLTSRVTLNFKRNMYHQLPWHCRMICIKGARGVGKTTLLLQRIHEAFPPADLRVLYVSLDELWFTDNRLIDLAEYHYTHGGTHLFLDEVHRYPQSSWAQELKNIYDRYPELHIVFTGSSVLEIDQSQADLSRRCLFFDMKGLSFREYLAFEHSYHFEPIGLSDLLTNHASIAAAITGKVHVLQYFDNYLRHGYYPFYHELEEGYEMALRQMVVNVIEQDIPKVQAMETITTNRLKRLVSLIAATTPFTINISRMANLLNCDRQMVYKLLHIAQRASLLNLLYKDRDNVQQLVKPEKAFLQNTNLMYALVENAEIGTIRETYIASQLLVDHSLTFSGTGDFLIDNKYTIEVGGKRKSFAQIKDVSGSFLAVDDIEIGHGNRIPLWLFGLLY